MNNNVGYNWLKSSAIAVFCPFRWSLLPGVFHERRAGAKVEPTKWGHLPLFTAETGGFAKQKCWWSIDWLARVAIDLAIKTLVSTCFTVTELGLHQQACLFYQCSGPWVSWSQWLIKPCDVTYHGEFALGRRFQPSDLWICDLFNIINIYEFGKWSWWFNIIVTNMIIQHGSSLKAEHGSMDSMNWTVRPNAGGAPCCVAATTRQVVWSGSQGSAGIHRSWAVVWSMVGLW